MIERPSALARVRDLFRTHPCVAILGPRQCGKTTLARMFAAGEPVCRVFDLESPLDARKLAAPLRMLGGLAGLVVLDEVQRRPELFEVLRVLVDRPGSETRFLVLGSAAPTLVKGASESLAGRLGFVDLGGFDLGETGPGSWERLWNRGGFPRSFLAPDDGASLDWRQGFVRTCCTHSSNCPGSMTSRHTPGSGPPGTASPWNRSWRRSAAAMPVSGPRMGAPNWT